MKIMNSQSVEKNCFLILVIVASFIFVSIVTAQAQTADSDTSKDFEFESQLEELLTTLYCPCGCVRETNKACVCATAQAIEDHFIDALTEGQTVEQIRTAYLKTYGSEFSAVMKAEGVNLIAYIMPAVILIAIGGVIYMIRHQSRSNDISLTQPDQQISISDELQQQVESELEKYKEQN
ncbi:MAG: cytochrome c-type biogenesis protein CcmH [Candidatus Poribacteria bacterium]|nr:cytochrome c-type biogenesis protein CcmH [Candidatus Poribacteria bacterium]